MDYVFALSSPKISSRQNCTAPQGVIFRADFGKDGRSRIEHTTRTYLAEDAEKVPLAAGSYYSRLLRDRAGNFKQQTLPSHARSDDTLEQMVILMYSKGVTTREIAELIEKMYGHYYSRQTISNITQTVQEQVSAFHNRSISKRFVVLYNGFNLVVIDNPSIFIMIGKDTFIIQKAFHNMLIYYLSESSMFVVP